MHGDKQAHILKHEISKGAIIKRYVNSAVADIAAQRPSGALTVRFIVAFRVP